MQALRGLFRFCAWFFGAAEAVGRRTRTVGSAVHLAGCAGRALRGDHDCACLGAPSRCVGRELGLARAVLRATRWQQRKRHWPPCGQSLRGGAPQTLAMAQSLPAKLAQTRLRVPGTLDSALYRMRQGAGLLTVRTEGNASA